MATMPCLAMTTERLWCGSLAGRSYWPASADSAGSKGENSSDIQVLQAMRINRVLRATAHLERDMGRPPVGCRHRLSVSVAARECKPPAHTRNRPNSRIRSVIAGSTGNRSMLLAP